MTESVSISIPARYIKGLLRVAATDDFRTYLNGIYFDPRGFAVVTDGHHLLAIKLSKRFPGDGFIVPRESFEEALKNANELDVNIRASDLIVTRASITVIHHAGKRTTVYNDVEFKYPDWRRVVPAKCSGDLAHYNSLYVENVRLALEDMAEYEPDVIIHCPVNFNGLQAGIAKTTSDVLAIIMPYRADPFDSEAHVKQFLGET